MNRLRTPEQISGIIPWTLAVFVLAAYVAFSFAYWQVTRNAAIERLRTESEAVTRTQMRALESELEKFRLLPLVLGDTPDVTDILTQATPEGVATLNEKFSALSLRTGASYIYLVDSSGLTVASSNHELAESFVGRRYQFRPYFTEAMSDGWSEYFAKGERTGKAGLFLARRVEDRGFPIGVIVVKVEFKGISQSWTAPNAITMVADQYDIVLFSSVDEYTYTTLSALPLKRREQIAESRQFWDEPLNRAALSIRGEDRARTAGGDDLLLTSAKVAGLDWRLVRFEEMRPALATAAARSQLVSLGAGFSLAALMLYFRRRAQREREKIAYTEKLEAEVQRRTHQLSDANRQLQHEMRERELINERFRFAREELAQANRLGSIGAITASVAHEINQPVAAIRAFAENALKFIERDKTPEAKRNLGSIAELTTRIGAITTELRRYSRRGSLAIASVPIDEVLDGVQLLIGDQLESEEIKLELTGEPAASLSVRAGRVRLEQVIVNILQNAKDALVDHTKPAIRLDISCTEKSVSILIADNGPGIEPGIESEIFNPFTTSKPGGLGIGLGIARDIVLEFGGEITVVPSPLGGAAFEVKLVRT